MAAEQAGHHVAAVSRRVGVDVQTGAGLDAALVGVDVIVDVINVETLSRSKATAVHPVFFPMGMYRSGDGYVNIAGIKSIEEFLEILDALGLLDDDASPPPSPAGPTGLRSTRRASWSFGRRRRPTGSSLQPGRHPRRAGLWPRRGLRRPASQHLELAQTVDDPLGTTAEVLRFPVTLTDTPASVRSGPPRPGPTPGRCLSSSATTMPPSRPCSKPASRALPRRARVAQGVIAVRLTGTAGAWRR